MSTSDAMRLLQAMERYSMARAEFLRDLGIGDSNRDPLAEFSEYLVASLVGGSLATSRVQKGFDVVDPKGEFVQVRYLANSAERWVNEHPVVFTEGLDAYALVVFENLAPAGVVIFPLHAMATIATFHGNPIHAQADTCPSECGQVFDGEPWWSQRWIGAP